MKTLYHVIFLLLVLSASDLAFAQGTIRGYVRDSLSNEPLPGANVLLVGTSLGASTDLNGGYKISDIPLGQYEVRVSYIGYTTKAVNVPVKGKEITELSILLPPQEVRGKEVVVTAQARGQVSAMNQQLSSNTIVNVISEEKIQQLPDANAAEAIGRLPGVSIVRSGGEADRIVLRGMGEQFSTISIDGFRMAATDSDNRSVDLSEISQSSLAGIELFKAITSDKDGDAIAGSVNLLTKKAPSQRLLWVDAKGVYNGLDKDLLKNQYNFALRYGERFFNDVLGVQLGGDLEQLIRSDEQYNVGYNTNLSNGTAWQYSDFTLDYINELRKRNGASVLLDINTPDNGTIRINNIYNKTERDFTDFNRDYPVGTSTSLVEYGARDRTEDIDSYNSSIRGDNNIFGLTVDWGLGFAQSKAYFPFDYELEFNEPSATDSTGKVISGMRQPPTSALTGPLQGIPQYAINNFQYAYLYTGFSRAEQNLEIGKTAFVDLSRKYLLGDWMSGELKVGGKFRSTTRYKTMSELASPYYINGLPQYVRLPDGTIETKQQEFAGTPFANLSLSANGNALVTDFLDPNPASRNLYDEYELYPVIDKSLLEEWYNLNINGLRTNSTNGAPEYSVDDEVLADYYDVTERVSAAYAMNTFDFGHVATLIMGVRAESENNDYTSKYTPYTVGGFPTPVGIVLDTTSSHQETVWLPNFQMLYKPYDFMNVRLAADRALARPDFNMRLNSFDARTNGTFYAGNNLTIGNPALRDAKAWNYEVNLSFFSNTIGLFSVSAFFKNITDMFHALNGAQIQGSQGQELLDTLGITWKNPYSTGGGDFALNYSYNSPKPTYVWGFEVEHQANLMFLPGLLQNIVLSYNFSIVRSQAYILGTSLIPDTTIEIIFGQPVKVPGVKEMFVQQKEDLEQQPEFFGNVALGYDYEGFSARVSLFHQGQYTQFYSADGRSDQVVNAFTRLDLSLKQEITRNISLMVNVNNLTDVREGTSLRDVALSAGLLQLTGERYGVTADAGIRISL